MLVFTLKMEVRKNSVHKMQLLTESVVGWLIYRSSDRMDVIFALKALTSKMAKPTLAAVQKVEEVGRVLENDR